jgi:hypothetical protein
MRLDSTEVSSRNAIGCGPARHRHPASFPIFPAFPYPVTRAFGGEQLLICTFSRSWRRNFPIAFGLEYALPLLKRGPQFKEGNLRVLGDQFFKKRPTGIGLSPAARRLARYRFQGQACRHRLGCAHTKRDRPTSRATSLTGQHPPEMTNAVVHLERLSQQRGKPV